MEAKVSAGQALKLFQKGRLGGCTVRGFGDQNLFAAIAFSSHHNEVLFLGRAAKSRWGQWSHARVAVVVLHNNDNNCDKMWMRRFEQNRELASTAMWARR